MKISASIFNPAKSALDFAHEAKTAGANCLHLDFSAQEPWPLTSAEITALAKETGMPLDVHLVQPALTDEDIVQWNSLEAEYLTIQLETLEHIEDIQRLKNFARRGGVGLMLSSPVNLLDNAAQYAAHVLLMSGIPGQSGGPFDESCIYRMIEIRKTYPRLAIHVDGGIDAQAMNILRAFHVDLVVSGSYLARAENMYGNLCGLRFGHQAHDLRIEHIMQPYARLPIVQEHILFSEILPTISHWFMGVVMVVDQHRQLRGLITDGDLRRALQSMGPGIFKANASSLMNPCPRTVSPDMNILQFARFVSDTPQGLVVIPVVKHDGTLVGAVDLHSNLFF